MSSAIESSATTGRAWTRAFTLPTALEAAPLAPAPADPASRPAATDGCWAIRFLTDELAPSTCGSPLKSVHHVSEHLFTMCPAWTGRGLR